MKGNQRNFRSAMSLMLSFIPPMEKWASPFSLFRGEKHVRKGSVDRYAGIHPKARNKAQECARRVRQGLV